MHCNEYYNHTLGIVAPKKEPVKEKGKLCAMQQRAVAQFYRTILYNACDPRYAGLVRDTHNHFLLIRHNSFVQFAEGVVLADLPITGFCTDECDKAVQYYEDKVAMELKVPSAEKLLSEMCRRSNRALLSDWRYTLFKLDDATHAAFDLQDLCLFKSIAGEDSMAFICERTPSHLFFVSDTSLACLHVNELWRQARRNWSKIKGFTRNR